MEGLNITVNMKVEGEETMDVSFGLKNTNLKTVLGIEQGLVSMFSGLLKAQVEKEETK